MRGDAQWFNDILAEVELQGAFERAMFDMGLDIRRDSGFAAWFHFQSHARFADKPVWMHETFKDYGGYQAYIDDYRQPNQQEEKDSYDFPKNWQR